jgi:formylglycine-generating enzyme
MNRRLAVLVGACVAIAACGSRNIDDGLLILHGAHTGGASGTGGAAPTSGGGGSGGTTIPPWLSGGGGSQPVPPPPSTGGTGGTHPVPPPLTGGSGGTYPVLTGGSGGTYPVLTGGSGGAYPVHPDAGPCDPPCDLVDPPNLMSEMRPACVGQTPFSSMVPASYAAFLKQACSAPAQASGDPVIVVQTDYPGCGMTKMGFRPSADTQTDPNSYEYVFDKSGTLIGGTVRMPNMPFVCTGSDQGGYGALRFGKYDAAQSCVPTLVRNPCTDKTDGGVAPPSEGVPFVPTNARSCGDKADGGAGLLCNGESCCTSITVPAGGLLMGRGTENCGPPGCQTDPDTEGCPQGMWCEGGEQPEHKLLIGAFALDKYEVTVGRFRKFVDAYGAGWRPAVGAGKNPNVTTGDTSWQVGWNDSATAAEILPRDRMDFVGRLNCYYVRQAWTDAPGTHENRAIECVNWYEAFAFCIWDGGRLPTEAEWERAAAGGEQNRLFPWASATPDCSYANFDMTGWAGEWFCGGDIYGASDVVGIRPKGNGRWGHADLGGNVQEWTFDWGGEYSLLQTGNYVAFATSDGAFWDSHPVRGGDGASQAQSTRAASRNAIVTLDRTPLYGLRCARAAP